MKKTKTFNEIVNFSYVASSCSSNSMNRRGQNYSPKEELQVILKIEVLKQLTDLWLKSE